MPFQELTTQRLYQRVAAQIEAMIRQGELPPGERLPAERDLATQFAVSRPVVREAMVALEIAALVEIRTGSGCYVAGKEARGKLAIDPALSIFDILAARRVVEGEVAAMAAQTAGADAVGRLAMLIEAQAAAMAKDGSGHLHDRAFHRELAVIAENEALMRLVEGLWKDMFTPVFERLAQAAVGPGTLRSTIADHQAIASAIARNDGDAARQAMHRHIDHTGHLFLGET